MSGARYGNSSSREVTITRSAYVVGGIHTQDHGKGEGNKHLAIDVAGRNNQWYTHDVFLPSLGNDEDDEGRPSED